MRILIEVGIFLIVVCFLWFVFDRLVLKQRKKEEKPQLKVIGIKEDVQKEKEEQ